MTVHDSTNAQNNKVGAPECFIIMPIADTDSYEKGHFQHVFENLIAPACAEAGYQPLRADQVMQTNLIHLDVLQRLIESPMAICDLSSRNPNVLFELGLRQAFDKPVVLIQEIGTPKIFDIAPLRYAQCRKEMRYHEVLEDQKSISQAVIATREANKESINSIVKLLSITKPAVLPEISETNRDPALQVIRAELSELRADIRNLAVSAVLKPITLEHLDFNWVRDFFHRVESRITTAKNRQEAMNNLEEAEGEFRKLLSHLLLAQKEQSKA